MFERIKKYKRYKDYITISSLEVKCAIICTVLFCIIGRFLDIYQNIQEYSDILMNLVLYTISGEFCLFGMVLAGIALVVSLITESMRKQMKSQGLDDFSERIMSQFEFSAANLVVQIMYLFAVYLVLSSDRRVLDEKSFYAIFVFVIYHLSFNVFYILQLISNCIKLNSIKEKCGKINQIEKTLLDSANEIRIDYILAIMLKEKNINRDEFVKMIDEMIEKSNYEDSAKLKQYIHNYYYK